MDAQVLADELAQPEGCLVVVHGWVLLGSWEEPAVAVSPAGRQHGVARTRAGKEGTWVWLCSPPMRLEEWLGDDGGEASLGTKVLARLPCLAWAF